MADSRGGSTYRLLIVCAREGRICFRNGELTFRMRVMRNRKATHDFIEMIPRQIECYNELVAADVIVPPTNTAPAALNETMAYEFLNGLGRT